MFRCIERWYPSIGFLAAITVLAATTPSFITDFSQDISNAFFIIFSICCGFISTSLSILFSLQDRRSMKGLKASGAFYEIISYHWKAILWSFFAILGAFGVVLCKNLASPFVPYVSFLMLSLGMGALLAVFRVIHIFVKVLQLDEQ